ncbi:MAG: Bax inhibitor-1/YccA family protein [Lachnospiraceae bacterium]
MSFENDDLNNQNLSDNNNFNSYYTQEDLSNTEWQGKTWGKDYTGHEPSYSYSGRTVAASENIVSRLSDAMEGSVVTQSFIFMFVALLITAITSLYVASSPRLMITVIDNYTMFIVAELAIVIITNITAQKNKLIPSTILFTLYTVINGITLTPIFYVYTGTSIATTFFITATIFGVMAVYGLVTKKDLTSIGNLCIMALFGIILAGVVNMFLGNTMLDTGISVLGIIIFIGLTAYDAQRIKQLSYVCGYESVTCVALLGAIELYLDFINIFLKLLSLMGKRK